MRALPVGVPLWWIIVAGQLAQPVDYSRMAILENPRRISNGSFTHNTEEREMSKSNAFENSLLLLIFNATAMADLAENDSSSPATTLTVALHTADPGEAGDMSTSEATYTSYARETVARTSGGWTVTGNSVSPAAAIEFAAATGGSETLTHFSVGTGVSDNMLYSGTISPNVTISTGVAPRLTTASAITED